MLSPSPSGADPATAPGNSSPPYALEVQDEHELLEPPPEKLALAERHMSGMADVAVLPSGVLSGHFIDPRSGTCFAIMGKQVVSENVCYRDPDWSLCKLTLINNASGKELGTWVQRTGGDMLTFRPPDLSDDVTSQAVHADMLELDDEAECEQMPCVIFNAENILCGAEAEAHLTKFNPKICGRDAIVTQGSMQVIKVPSWFV